MVGRTLVSVSVTHDRTARHNGSPQEVIDRIRGRRVLDVNRHGKFLRFSLDDEQTVIAHLGMSGRWAVDPAPTPHTHFVATLDSGSTVAFIDPRTFGFVAVYDEEELVTSGISRLGPDAWTSELAADEILGRLSSRTAPIKALLLDQGIVAGLGNIYADEVLFASGVHPLTPGNQVSPDLARALLGATKTVLAAALENGGTTLDDLAYLLPDGRAGDNLSALKVYGRTDEPCFQCGTPIERVIVRARSTHFCPTCQALS